PRALGRHRLPARAEGRGDPAGRAALRGGGRVRRPDLRPALPQGLVARAGVRAPAVERRHALRPPGRGGVPRDDGGAGGGVARRRPARRGAGPRRAAARRAPGRRGGGGRLTRGQRGAAVTPERRASAQTAAATSSADSAAATTITVSFSPRRAADTPKSPHATTRANAGSRRVATAPSPRAAATVTTATVTAVAALPASTPRLTRKIAVFATVATEIQPR